MHLTEARDIPDLRPKVTSFFNLSFVETNVLASRRDAHQTKSQAVGTILIDQLQRIRRIAQRLRHLSTEVVADNAGEENVTKWNVVLGLCGRGGVELKAC